MIHNLQLVGLLFVALFYSSKGSGGINSVVTSLSEFQSVDVGGFQFNRYSAPTLQDTSDALFLSSLFGCNDKVNLIGASKFITSLRNLDGGYCDQPGAISDAVSVRNAIVSLSYLGTAIDEKQTEAIGAFLDSLFDAETKLFAPRKGASGDIHSTAVVLEAYERLGLGSAAPVTEKKNALKKAFATLVKTDAAGRKYFYSITADNAYAVIAASLVGFDFGQKEAWAQYFENRQVQDGFWKGGFYSDSDRVDVTTNDATLSVQALYQLYGKLVSTIDTAALLAYANALPGDLRVATQSYKAIARSAAFTSLFKLEPIFATQQGRHRVVNGRIVTGSLVKPSLVVRSNFGIPQSALAVKVSVTFEGEVASMGLVWDQEHQVYIGEDFFPTEGKLGSASFDYTVQWTGEHSLLSLSSANAVSIGYWSNVKLNKAISGGNEVEPGVGAVVEYGAAFALTATYGTAEHKTSSPLKQGPFEVILTVVDSSNAEIHRNVLDASKGKPFSFNYQLNQQDIPAGVLTLKVAVKDTAKGIVHTEDSFTFVVHPQMVASNLNFAGDSTQYHIGDRVEISMVPANLPDLKTVLPFTRHPRLINLNVMATSTEVLFSVPGVFNEEAGHYEFSFEIKPTFDSLGAHSVTFSYHAVNGDAFGLRLFNSGTNYLYDATENFVFTVLTRLVIQNDNAALKEGQQLQYGNEVAFTFKVFDEISKKNVWAGVRDANAYLVLEHEAGKASAFTSVRESVTQVAANGVPSNFAVQWSVSPNAPSGDAVLALVAQLPSGDSVPMLNSATKPWRVGVKIGGNIDVTKKSYSGKLNDDLMSFFVEFELSCQGKSLRGAQLSAVVSKDGASFDAPVAIGSHGRYQLSWTQRSKTVSAGDYQINIYRQVDKRSAEALPFRTVIHTHVPPATSPLPVRTEFVILLLLVGSFVWVTFKKMEIQGGSNSKQVK